MSDVIILVIELVGKYQFENNVGGKEKLWR